VYTFPQNVGTQVRERQRIRFIDMEKLRESAEALDFSADSDEEVN